MLWADLIRQLSYMWETNEQYAFGWFVPILALGLFLKKWPTRPQVSGLRSHPSSFRLLPSALILLTCLLLLPLRLIHEVNQDWALFSWLLTGTVVLLTLYALHLAGPTAENREQKTESRNRKLSFLRFISAFYFPNFRFATPWVAHFAFPVLFIFTAVRWPYRVENSLTYRLMGVVSASTVELLGWLGVPAVQHGHLIEVTSGTVGVDEACSGIRSFQSSLMAALFLGELYLLRWPARLLLVMTALAAAFVLNVGRTLLLTWQANEHGLSAIDKWHDPAGLSIAVGCFLILWILALLIRKWSMRTTQRSDVSDPKSAMASPARTTPQSHLPSAFSLQPCHRYLVAVGLWSLLCLGITEAWYRCHETSQSPATPSWWVQFPTNLPSARGIPITKTAREKLKYDAETNLAWEEPDGSKWSGYCFRWNAGVATSRMMARDHRPEYCLGGSGYNCQADFGVRYFPAKGLELPFRCYVFERAGVVLYVFHCLWEEGAAEQRGFGSSKYRDRLQTVLDGRRNLGQQTLEIILSGYPDMTAAESALRQRLPDLIKVEPRLQTTSLTSAGP